MKTIFALTLALCFSPAFSTHAFAGEQGQGEQQGQGQDQGKNQGYDQGKDQGYDQGQGQQGQGYGDEGQGYDDGYYTESHATCREGSHEMFLEDDGSGDHMSPVHYTCHNGRFVKDYPDYRDLNRGGDHERFSCREGSHEMFLEDDGSGDHMDQVHYTCRNGRFVKDYPDHRDFHRHGRRHLSCREGSTETFLEDDGSGDHTTPVQYVCHNGRFLPLYR
jgi:hypothetical protein